MEHVMKKQATLIGTGAILMWALLAFFTSSTSGIPPFQLLTLTFAVGGSFGMAIMLRKGMGTLKKLKQPAKVWVIGVAGLFGYHFFYFTALSNAPVADASLIAYLWPLLIVLFSAFLPGEKLRWFHLLGALCGLGGAVILIGSKGGFSFSSNYAVGYLAALICALTWSTYSVLNRAQGNVPTETVAGFCLVTALLALICHLGMESWVPPKTGQWLAILGLGIGPVGLAFYAWDFATKHGNIKMLGVLSYGAPLLSTVILTLTGQAPVSWALAVACLLITLGAIMASLDHFKQYFR